MNEQTAAERRSCIDEIVEILKRLEASGDKEGQNFVLAATRMAGIQSELRQTA